jgi:hypothetical protein
LYKISFTSSVCASPAEGYPKTQTMDTVSNSKRDRVAISIHRRKIMKRAKIFIDDK